MGEGLYIITNLPNNPILLMKTLNVCRLNNLNI